ncbi:family 78 glycoside hydrolase catalytic domain [Streptomyces turgidiscabies]|uniref:alpha-L-rhamnosidase n=1 Tax=Streptomyces turgidiscabies (strain Car8) TaxID=698760 RepID=L7ESP5_STRT8|nr:MULTISPECIES: family 78 glycoside hydrolase catalytic domain [Streptomyces]ELP62022.1 bacterial alpha-L-rhamnosidase [Streptomyces turgidiscabies Car8]MDX3499651.1 family 78 glycoside hydrolase catalytic domain [Streptomyces turgidiscabies]GAQ73405.1 bacterial alpha-L-rhamnosidase [Streptomyces turgidiscabies]
MTLQHPEPSTTVAAIRFEHRDDPLGVGVPAPRLSWQVRTDDPEWRQTAYEVQLDGAEVVRVESAEQILVAWPFEPLPSRARATVRIRVAAGESWSGWSAPATVETGLLRPQDWSARFITPRDHGALDSPAPELLRTVVLRPGMVSARLYATAHGVYTASLNGTRVGDEVLAPGWTSYHHRLRYQTHDVTALLTEGANTVSVLLGNGWYRGHLGWWGARALYGDRLALLAQLEVRYADGSVDVFGTDEEWRARDTGVVADDLYKGQRTDLRFTPGPATGPVEVLPDEEAALSRLVAPEGPPVRVTEELPALRVWQSPSGRTLADFGQNVVGWVRLRVRGADDGREVTVRHAEVLEDGELCTRPLRTADAVDTYLLAESAEAVLEPSFTFHGFRYAEITGVPDLTAEDLHAMVVGTDLRRTGWFTCSDPDLEQFHENVVRGTRGNFLDVPTDCPQRDERLGWTGDTQVFSPTAAFLFDSAGFLSTWLADLAVDQHPDGAVPWVIPDVMDVETPTAAAWGDAAAVVPWVLYERYGDLDVLRRQYASARAWVDKTASLTTDGVWTGGFQFGDWLDPAAPPDDPFAARTPADVVATACLIRCADVVARTADVLGQAEQAGKYRALAARTRDAFAREFVTPTGRIVGDSPTAYAMALQWELLAGPEQRATAGRRLADLVRTNGFRIATGFVGTPLMTDALTATGRPDLAYRLLLEKGCPSWLYPVTMGATTVWERWDSMLPDGTVNPGQMTSFNHYALGAVADWMHRAVAGLAPAAPGYREFTVRPLPDRALTHASARHITPYGEASVSWRRDAGLFHLVVTVPVGTRATVHLPGDDRPALTATHGTHTWTTEDPCLPATATVATVRDLMDVPELWEATVGVLIRHGLGTDPARLARRLEPYLDVPARELPTLANKVLFEDGGAGAAADLETLLSGVQGC